MEHYRNIDIKNVNHDSSFASLESGIIHFKYHIGIDDIINKRGKIGIVDYKNHISVDDIINKGGESGRVDYVFRRSKP